jgi:hypothetical protein
LVCRSFLPGCALVLVVGACGGDDEGDDGGDGRHRPPPNGVHMSETDACTELSGALRQRALSLGCQSTLRACPDFLRSAYDPDCAEYDRGTVDGCVAFYQDISSCSEIDPSRCVLVLYPESAPAGCP